MGLLGVRFEVGGGGKIPPCLKLVRITLEISNLGRQYTAICSFRRYTFQCLGSLNFADISIFFAKNLPFFIQKSTFTQSNSVRAVLEIVWFCFQFLFTENITFADSLSGILPPDCSKLAKNLKNGNGVTIFRHDVIINFFDIVLFLLSSLATGPSFTSISSLVLEL